MTTPAQGNGWQHEGEQRPDADSRRAGLARDAGLRRISRLTGLAVAVAIALTVGLSEVAARTLPGQSSHHSASKRRTEARVSTIPAPSSQSDQASSTLQQPEQTPQPSAASGGTVSGGS